MEGEDIFHINAKRLKVAKDDTYTCHCCLGHIGKARMKQIYSDGLLESFDEESFDRCEACLMGKLIRTRFNGIVGWATELLKIIHIDVCGPLNIPARGGLMIGDEELGGAPSEGVDVASNSFPSIKNQGLIEPVGLQNQQRGAHQQSLALNLR